MPEMNLSFEIPEIKIQVAAVEYVCGQIKGHAARNQTTGKWVSSSSTKNWETESSFSTIEEAQDYTVQQIKLAAMKKAAVAALNEQLEMFDA